MFSALLKQGANPTPHLDRGSFLSSTTVQASPLHGRGLFATRDLAPGDLVLVEKAALMPNQYSPTRASAALYASMVRQLCDNPSLCSSILPLFPGDDFPYSYAADGRSPGDIVDNHPIIDVFQAEGIRTKNCFSLPLATVLATRPSMPDNLLAKGLWVYSSYMNHSCVPNTMRSFMGDLLISRATRHIKKGDEIFQQYCPVKPVPEVREKQFEESWGFKCVCVLCASERKASASSPQTQQEKWKEMMDKIDKVCGKRKIPDNIAVNKGIKSEDMVPEAAIRQVDKLMRQLEDLHDVEVYDGVEEGTELVPRLTLVYPTNWLISAHRGRKNWVKVVKYGLKVLRNFGFKAVTAEQEKADRIEGVEWDPMGLWNMDENRSAGLMTVHVVAALRRLNEAYEALGRKEMARRCEEAARFGYMLVCGFDAELSNLDM